MQRKRRSRAEKIAIARDYESSEKTRAEFCRPLGLAPTTLDSWRGLAKRQARLVRVEVRGLEAGPGLALVLGNGRRIEVGTGFDEAALARLLAVAERG